MKSLNLAAFHGHVKCYQAKNVRIELILAVLAYEYFPKYEYKPLKACNDNIRIIVSISSYNVVHVVAEWMNLKLSTDDTTLGALRSYGRETK